MYAKYLNHFLLLAFSVFVQTDEKSDFVNERISFLEPSFMVDPQHFNSFPSNSCVILDDYVYNNKKQQKLEFLKVINFILRHKKIILFIICHNIVHNGLYTDILYAPHLFISYSNVGYSIMR